MRVCSQVFFKSESEAVHFESQNRAKHGYPQQFVYKCHQCDGYHLAVSERTAKIKNALAQGKGYDEIAQQDFGGVCVKKRFTSREDAEKFELEHRAENGQQHPYFCYQCGGFHLTSSNPQLQVAAEPQSTSTETPPETTEHYRGRPIAPNGVTKGRVRERHAQGKGVSEIAEELGISDACVRYHLDHRVKREPLRVLSLELLIDQERELRQKLEKIAAEKAALQEALRFKLSWTSDNRVSVSKEGNTIVATVEEWERLLHDFMDLVTEPSVAVDAAS